MVNEPICSLDEAMAFNEVDPAGHLDQDGSLKVNLISLSNEMTQITQDCRGLIDLSIPPTGYTKEVMNNLKSDMFAKLCKIENCSR